MSAPGTIAILKDGSLRVFTGRCLAYAFDDPMVIWGPDWLCAYAVDCYGTTERDVLNCAYDEAAALVDFDNRVLLFYGGEMSYDLQTREDTLAIMRATTWRGWEVTYAEHEFHEICDRLGRQGDARDWRDDQFDFAGDYIHEMLSTRCAPESASSYVILRGAAGIKTKLLETISGQNILEHGPGILDMFDAFDEPPVKLHLSQLCAGVLIDEDAREVVYWASQNDCRLDYFRRTWRGWRVRESAGWREFVALAPGILEVAFDLLTPERASELIDFAYSCIGGPSDEDSMLAERIKQEYRGEYRARRQP